MVRKEVMLSRTNLDWLHPSSSAFFSLSWRGNLTFSKKFVKPTGACLLHNDIVRHLTRKDSFKCVQAMFPLFLSSCMDMEILILQVQNLVWALFMCAFKQKQKCCLCYSGNIEICHTEYSRESILTLFTHICFEVGLLLSHDRRTEPGGTDGSNCLISRELLNISVHKVGETNYAFCLGSQMSAGCVCVDNPVTFTLQLNVAGTTSSKEPALC